MDEEEYQRIVSGAAGALADTWKKTSDFFNNENQSWPFAKRTTVQERYNTPEGWHFMSDPEVLLDWMTKNPETAKKFIDTAIGAAAGLPPLMTIPSALYESRELLEGWLSEYFDIQREDLEGKGEVAGEDVEIKEAFVKPEYTPLEFGEFEYGHWTEGLGEPNPEIGGRYGSSGNTHLDYFNLKEDLIDKGTIERYIRPEWAKLKLGNPIFPDQWTYEPGVTHSMIQDHANDWLDSIVPAIHAEEERKWQLEYDAAKEAFDKRNEEEERRHREEYDKMVADMLAEQELEASMDTDFSTGDLGEGSRLSPTGELLKILGDYFNKDSGYGPAESTPPSWLSVPNASTMPQIPPQS